MTADRSRIWLTLAPNVQIEVETKEALALDLNGFADLYQNHVLGATRHEATEWARSQIRQRAAVYKEADSACL